MDLRKDEGSKLQGQDAGLRRSELQRRTVAAETVGGPNSDPQTQQSLFSGLPKVVDTSCHHVCLGFRFLSIE